MEIGFSYAEGALTADGTDAPPRDPSGRIYQPTTRPGHRLPHSWIERDGQRRSTHDLTGHGQWALITGPAGEAWIKAAEQVGQQLGIDIVAVTIGDHSDGDHSGGDYVDADGAWSAVRGIADAGAVLVRPDNFVAYRAADAVADPQTALTEALSAILAR